MSREAESVWVVEQGKTYEGATVVGVWEDRESALSFILEKGSFDIREKGGDYWVDGGDYYRLSDWPVQRVERSEKPKLAVVENDTETGTRDELHTLIETWAGNLGQSVSEDLSAFDLAALERMVRAWAGGDELRLQAVLSEIDFYAAPDVGEDLE